MNFFDCIKLCEIEVQVNSIERSALKLRETVTCERSVIDRST